MDVLKTQLEKMGAPVFLYQIQPPNKHPLQDIVNGIMLILNVMAILTLGLGLLLVINTVNAIVAQQVPQIGVMKAIGGTTRQMLLLYLSGVLVYGVLAVFIAVPLGIAVAADVGRHARDHGHSAGSGVPRLESGRDAAAHRRPARAAARRVVADLCRRAPHRARGDQQLWHQRQLTAKACSIASWPAGAACPARWR